MQVWDKVNEHHDNHQTLEWIFEKRAGGSVFYPECHRIQSKFFGIHILGKLLEGVHQCRGPIPRIVHTLGGLPLCMLAGVTRWRDLAP